MKKTNKNDNEVNYSISSRATMLLGRQNVSNEFSALIELIKNSYDADADFCAVIYNEIRNTLIVLDNGCGMSKETIKENWMIIGTNNKMKSPVSPRGRIRSGEKGIGRFALDRLGVKCTLLTKEKASEEAVVWINDWSLFDIQDQMLHEVFATLDNAKINFKDALYNHVAKDFLTENEITNAETGSILEISNLRDVWTEEKLLDLVNEINYTIPPTPNQNFKLFIQKSFDSKMELVENILNSDFDYEIRAVYEDNNFNIIIDRNEFNLTRIPDKLFESGRFSQFPYTQNEFKNHVIEYDYKPEELFNLDIENKDDQKTLVLIKGIGNFKFTYQFFKRQTTKKDKDTFFYKDISSKRKGLSDSFVGIRVYRDNFLVKPYGLYSADGFDWLRLDSRRADSPAALSHRSESWKVRNSQSYGYIELSRITNPNLIDKSNREGIIENEYFSVFKNVIVKIISLFEKDRSYIGRTFKEYQDLTNKKKKIIEDSKEVIRKHSKSKTKGRMSEEEAEGLMLSYVYMKEEIDELISEIKLLRSLATNGLLTTTIVHDLKGLRSILDKRAVNIRSAILSNDNDFIDEKLINLKNDDAFLKSWLDVIANPIRDKRRRRKKDVLNAISKIINNMKPILSQKQIKLNFEKNYKNLKFRFFESDIESIMYNLIINSIESFQKSNVQTRTIQITVKVVDSILRITYSDNGKGINDTFRNPYEIFTLGTTTKTDKNGKAIGTGLGMYIVSSTINEYNGNYDIKEYRNKFILEFGLNMGVGYEYD